MDTHRVPNLRLVGVILLSLGVLPSLAGAQSAPVYPILECVRQNGPSQYVAIYGYNSANGVPVTIPVGPKNKFTPAPQDRGQTTVFQPGRTPVQGAFQVLFNESNLVWMLKGPDGTTRARPRWRSQSAMRRP